MLRQQAFKYRLEPIGEQLLVMEQTAGVCRYIWNSALALQKHRLARGGRVLNYAELCRELTAVRTCCELAFVTKVHSKPQQQKLKDLCKAFGDFFSKKRGFPRFKKKGRHDSFRHPQGVEVRGHQVKIPGIGWVRFRKSREIVGTIKNATVSKRGGRWYVSIQTEREVATPVHPSRSAVGIDLGVAKFAAFSDGFVVEPKNLFRKMSKRLARAQRRLSRKKKFSANWHKQRARIAKLHSRTADARNDFLHKLSHTTSKNHAMIVMEELKVKNMSASAKGTKANPGSQVRQKSGLNKSILDQGWYEFRRQIGYKQDWRGGLLVLVPPQNTSRRCVRCAHLDAGNRRSQATFACTACGHQDDADINAAVNILAAGHVAVACGGKPLGISMKQEPRLGRKAQPLAA